jgi:hypothetical protein
MEKNILQFVSYHLQTTFIILCRGIDILLATTEDLAQGQFERRQFLKPLIPKIWSYRNVLKYLQEKGN